MAIISVKAIVKTLKDRGKASSSGKTTFVDYIFDHSASTEVYHRASNETNKKTEGRSKLEIILFFADRYVHKSTVVSYNFKP